MAKKKTNRQKLYKKLDKLSAEFTHLKDNCTCQMCGKVVSGSDCHVSHIIPRSRGVRFRWLPENLMVKCFHCHIHIWHKNPVKAGAWFSEKYPQRNKFLQDQEKLGLKRFSVIELEELRDWYIREIEEAK